MWRVGIAGVPERCRSAGAAGRVHRVHDPDRDQRAVGDRGGADGNVWFTETNGDKIGRITPTGTITVEFGPTTSYGQSTAVQSLAPSETQRPFSAAVSGLPAGTLHYRAVATSDFGTFAGPDTTVQIPATVGHATVKGTTATVRVSCTGATGATSKLAFRMTVTEKLRDHKIIAVTARKKPKTHKVVVTVGAARGLTLS